MWATHERPPRNPRVHAPQSLQVHIESEVLKIIWIHYKWAREEAFPNNLKYIEKNEVTGVSKRSPRRESYTCSTKLLPIQGKRSNYSILSNSTRANTKFESTTECEGAFQALNKHMYSQPAFAKHEPGQALILYFSISYGFVTSVLAKELENAQLPTSIDSSRSPQWGIKEPKKCLYSWLWRNPCKIGQAPYNLRRSVLTME